MATTPTKKQPVAGSIILVSSGYGANTRKPFVMVETDKLDQPLQFSPEEARDLALNLLSCADAAEGDGFLVEFFRKDFGADEKMIGALLIAFRKWRADRQKGENAK